MLRPWILAAALFAGLVPALAHAVDRPAAALSAGEVRKVDREAKKVTIKHGPIENLKMPPMTMVFRVKDKAMLDGLAPGAAVQFRAEEAEGGYVITTLQSAKAK